MNPLGLPQSGSMDRQWEGRVQRPQHPAFTALFGQIISNHIWVFSSQQRVAGGGTGHMIVTKAYPEAEPGAIHDAFPESPVWVGTHGLVPFLL